MAAMIRRWAGVKPSSSELAIRYQVCRCQPVRLTIAALNCSAWPLHPVVGPAHVELMRKTIELAGRRLRNQVGPAKCVPIFP